LVGLTDALTLRVQKGDVTMRVLVVVASKHGSTREIATAITEELGNAQFSVDLHDLQAEDTVGDIAGYDAVILGSAIYLGSWLPAARRFAEQHRAALAKVPLWVFSSGPVGKEGSQAPQDPDKLAASFDDMSICDHQIFVGKIDQADLGFWEGLLMKVMKPTTGDFRNWDAIRAWAREIATTLQATDSAPAR